MADLKDDIVLFRTQISTAWTLRALSGPAPLDVRESLFDAPVPGDVHTALRRAGVLPDPSDGDNEHHLSWIGETAWEYSTRLPALPLHARDAERIDLVFHGVDTIATVNINGEPRARLTNMHRTWRVPAHELAERDASLTVAIDSPVAAAQAQLERVGARWAAFSPLAPFIRKNACAFGWDWGPALPGAGIWRNVEIDAWSTARLAAVRPTVTLESDDGVIDLDIDLERTASAAGAPLRVLIELGGASAIVDVEPDATRLRARLDVAAPARWWPVGLGPQPLHDLQVTLEDEGGRTLDRTTTTVGFRELIVEQHDDAEGTGFGVVVNGVPVFVRGFNWIPDDTSISAVTDDDIRTRVGEAVALGANLIRVWGGGVFESDAFYRACDEAGVLVWQDFLFACGAYPEEDPFPAEIEAEARDNVSRLMSHPSLAIWNANNENLWFWFLHDWQTSLDGATWGEGYYFDLLPRVLADLDPQRTYLVGSPSSGGRWEAPNDPTRGVVHWWIPDDYRAYDDVRPRFVSEFGFQGPPARATFDAVVHDEHPAPFSPGVVQRQKAAGGTERINDVLAAHFGVPVDFDEWYWLAQLDQARAVRYGVERFRTLEPYCRGTIIWQLNDCWPALSWSMIDSADRWKPVAYAVREAYRDSILVLRIEDGLPVLYGCNSVAEAWDVEVRLDRFVGSVVSARSGVRATVPPHTAARIPLGDLGAPLTGSEVLVATTMDAGGERYASRTVVLGTTDREFPDAPASFSVELEQSAAEVTITLTAHSLLRDTAILVDELDPEARADRNLLTLLPGERATWRVSTSRPDDFDEQSVRALVRTARAARTHDAQYRGLAQLEAEKRAAGLPV